MTGESGPSRSVCEKQQYVSIGEGDFLRRRTKGKRRNVREIARRKNIAALFAASRLPFSVPVGSSLIILPRNSLRVESRSKNEIRIKGSNDCPILEAMRKLRYVLWRKDKGHPCLSMSQKANLSKL